MGNAPKGDADAISGKVGHAESFEDCQTPKMPSRMLTPKSAFWDKQSLDVKPIFESGLVASSRSDTVSDSITPPLGSAHLAAAEGKMDDEKAVRTGPYGLHQ